MSPRQPDPDRSAPSAAGPDPAREGTPPGADAGSARQARHTHLSRRISELDLSVRSMNLLGNMEIEYVYQIVSTPEIEFLRRKCFGRKGLNEIKAVLEGLDLSLGMEPGDFPGREGQG